MYPEWPAVLHPSQARSRPPDGGQRPAALLALEDKQFAGFVLRSVVECGQRCLDPGEARFDDLLAQVLEDRDGTQLQPLEVLGQVRRATPADFITGDECPPGAGEVTFRLVLGPE